jgi:hypothetical protein
MMEFVLRCEISVEDVYTEEVKSMLVILVCGIWLVVTSSSDSVEVCWLFFGIVMKFLFPPGRSNTLNKGSDNNKMFRLRGQITVLKAQA